MIQDVIHTQPVPSVKGLPFLGNMLEFRRDPVEALYNAWKQAGDMFTINVGPRTFWIISDPKLAQEMLIEQKNVFQRPRMVHGGTILAYLLGTSVLTIDGEPWLNRRRMMQPIFHKQRIQAMGDTMLAAGQDMLQRWDEKPAGQPMNLNEELRLVTLDVINRTMFSTDVLPEVSKVGHSVEVGVHYVTNRTQSLVQIPENWPTPANRRFAQSQAALDEYLYRIIRQRRSSDQHPGDLLDMLLEARDEETGEGLDDEQVRNEVATVYGAGHETTSVALTWTWFALNHNPKVLKNLQEELDRVLGDRPPAVSDLPNLPYTQAIFEETLRVYPPVPMTFRVAEEATRLGEYAIPQGAFTGVAIYNIHHHPDYWEEPQRFMPERFLPENKEKLNRLAYVPFLTGPHLCIGNNFALMEGPLLLALMAQRYDLRMVPGQKIEREIAVTMRPKPAILVQRLER